MVGERFDEDRLVVDYNTGKTELVKADKWAEGMLNTVNKK
jgi:hypothetical protein